MEAIKQTVIVPATRELCIQLPEAAIAHEEAEVIVLFKSRRDDFGEKIEAIRQAANDEIFLEVAQDFEYSDRDESGL
ncbi:MAG: hypothetical protein L0229_30185 [Blastocatellia bacterium]|nr:hypothetical protein [Blastocatellia bacterium]